MSDNKRFSGAFCFLNTQQQQQHPLLAPTHENNVQLLKHGTTILALEYKKGMLVAADGLGFKGSGNPMSDQQRTKDTADNKFDEKINTIGVGTNRKLVAHCGSNVYYVPILVELMTQGNKSVKECAEHTKMFLNKSDYDPSKFRTPQGTLKPEDLENYGCEMIFASYERNDANVLVPQLMYANKEEAKNVNGNFICLGTGAQFAIDVLSTKQLGELDKAEAIIAMLAACKDQHTGGLIRVKHIDSQNVITDISEKTEYLLNFENLMRDAKSRKRDREKQDEKETGSKRRRAGNIKF